VKYWEDFTVGEVIELGSCAITETEILAFARKYDPQPFHTDPEAARRSIFGGLIASGWHTCALLMRLSVETSRREDAAATGSPGLDSCRSRSKPIGFIRRRNDLANQHGEVVVSVVGITMYQRRPAAAA